MSATFNWTLWYGPTATKAVNVTYTKSGSETQESGAGAAGTLNRIDFLSLDSGECSGGNNATPINYFDYPIRAGNNSFERWVRLVWNFAAGTNKISGVRFWMSSGDNTSGSAINIFGLTTGTYAAPATGTTIVGANYATWTNVGATYSGNIIPTGTVSTAPTTPATNIAYWVPFSGNATVQATGSSSYIVYSDWIVLQLRTTSSAAPGNVEVKQFTVQYDES